MADDTILKPQEAAAFIGVSLRTLDNHRRANDAPPRVTLSARRVGYRKSSLVAWLESREGRGERQAA